MAECATLLLSKGEDYVRTFVRANAGVPVNLSSFFARLQVRAAPGAADVLLDVSSATSRITLDSAGHVVVRIAAGDVGAIAVPDPARLAYQAFGVFTIVLTAPDGTTECAWEGTAAISPAPMRAMNAAAVRSTLLLDASDDWTRTVVYAIGGAPVDLTGYTALLQVRETPASADVLLEASSDAASIDLDSAGNITVRFASAAMTAVAVPDPARLSYQAVGVYALLLTAPDGTTVCGFYGSVAIRPALGPTLLSFFGAIRSTLGKIAQAALGFMGFNGSLSAAAGGIAQAAVGALGYAGAASSTVGGVAQSASGTMDAYPAYTAFDSFTRANSASSLGSASEKGGAWTVLTGTGGIAGGKAYAVGGELKAKLGTLPGGNGFVQADLTSNDWTFHPVQLFFRLSDANNALVLICSSANNMTLRSLIAGTLTTLSGFSSPALVAGVPAALRVVVAGTLVTAYVNGVAKGSYTLTGAAAALAGTAAGIWVNAASGNDATTTVDNYQVGS